MLHISIVSWGFFKHRCIGKCPGIDKCLCLQWKTYFLLCICSTRYRVVLDAAKYSDSQDYQRPLSAPVHLKWYRTKTSACQQDSVRHFSSVGVPTGIRTTVSGCPGTAQVQANEVFIRTVGEPGTEALCLSRAQCILQQFIGVAFKVPAVDMPSYKSHPILGNPKHGVWSFFSKVFIANFYLCFLQVMEIVD